MKQAGARLEALDARGLRFAVVASRFNPVICARLLDGALAALARAGAADADVEVVRVPGAFEIPVLALRLAQTKRFDAIICLGAVIRGETPHFESIASAVAHGITRAGLASGTPMTFGVLTTHTVEEALARSEPGDANKGAEAAYAAVEMAHLIRSLERTPYGRPPQSA